MTGSHSFRRARHIVAYWRDGAFVLHNYATNEQIAAAPPAVDLLDACAGWTSLDQLAALMPDIDAPTLAAAVRLLSVHGFLEHEGHPLSAPAAAMHALDDWNPAAGFFHTATRVVTFADAESAREIQAGRARERPWPGPVRRYAGAPTAPLPMPADDGWAKTLRARRTWRQFAARSVSKRDLARLLWLTAGIQFRAAGHGAREFCYRTSPSGGALQPIEVYLAVSRVNGVKPGLYHYASDDHLLEMLGAARVPDLARYLPSQPWFTPAPVVLFFVAHMERSLWRYGYARAYRSLLIEAGHLCQTFCLTATRLGLAPFSTMALADREIDADLGLNGITESVVYAAGAGHRPRGARLAPAPEGFPQPQLRPNRPSRRGQRR